MRRAKATLPSDPLWYKDAVIYELHVKCFFDSNNDGIGDFQGLIQKLDYLQDLGITCIWLLPFYPSPLRDDGYDISDYEDVHSSFGTLKDFRQLINEAHSRGIRIITELVINHTSDQHPWFQAARKAPIGSAKRDYYVWSDSNEKYKGVRVIFKDSEKSNWTWDPVANSFFWHRFFSHQPDLNFDSPHVRQALLRIMHFWLEMGVDGLRLDAVPYLVEREGTPCENLPETHAFLKEMRKEMDARYKDRIFLAEANQWPTDVRPYFGEDDECHMAFHFPLMPRIFMALRQEDRHPITEILRQTPEIPPNCQWAIFLRNHDELTLEMVTDEERDYMYTQYATDPLMRLNLGIRRRLAPLVDNSRRRLELLFSLLFSFPGTPVLYYGDEIAMGDNYYLGDRNGVRTPMQWSDDRNGGFSRADFAKLYAPPLVDSNYGFHSVNVEAQLRDSSSLLNWLKRTIAISKRFKTFGRGTLQFLSPANRKVLAYVRTYGDDVFLAVANLSRFAQPAELNLAEFAGRLPVEMLGSVEFPKIGELPYFLTMAPHAFFWFQLQRVAAPVTPVETHTAPPSQKVQEEGVTMANKTQQSFLEKPTRAEIEKNILPVFIARQRWYGHKSSAIKSTRFMDYGRIDPSNDSHFITLLEVESADGRKDLYNVPLGIAWGAEAQTLQTNQAGAVLTPVHGAKGDGVLYDLTIDDEFCRQWLKIMEQKKSIQLTEGTLQGMRLASYDTVLKDEEMSIKHLSGEQSNTSIRLGSRLIMKLYRHLLEGTNPDFEVSRFLTEQAHFDRIPKVVTGVEYLRKGHEAVTLSMVEEWTPNQGDGWAYTLDELSRYFERVISRLSTVENLDLKQGLPMLDAQELVGGYLHSATMLGKRTAELHRALATAPPENKDFSPEPLTDTYLAALCKNISKSAQQTLDDLQNKYPELSTAIQPKAKRIMDLREDLLCKKSPTLNHSVAKGLIRCHGDFHLGQLLWTNNDFIIIDFEGEPARSLAQRREKQSPLKDVAGMLRSFHYAAYAGLFKATAARPADLDKLEPAATFWVAWATSNFLTAYRETIAGSGCVPEDATEFRTLLNLFLMDKALYEILYELDNRPAWIGIPLEGILSLLPQPVAAKSS